MNIEYTINILNDETSLQKFENRATHETYALHNFEVQFNLKLDDKDNNEMFTIVFQEHARLDRLVSYNGWEMQHKTDIDYDMYDELVEYTDYNTADEIISSLHEQAKELAKNEYERLEKDL